MGQNLLDEASAAEIMGVERSTVFGWCKNSIINCLDAPKEYVDKTKYLIDEEECNYVSNLIKKFGTKKALLYYQKSWKNPSREEEKKMDIIDNIPWSMEEVEEVFEPVKTPGEKSTREEDNTNKLVSSIMYAHSLKEKIAKFENELSKLKTEYTEIKDNIANQL